MPRSQETSPIGGEISPWRNSRQGKGRRRAEQEAEALTKKLAEKPTRFHVENMPKGALSGDSRSLVRTPSLYPHRISCRRRCSVSNLVLDCPQGHAVSFRRADFLDAHGMGAAGLWTAGIAIPLLGQARLQQFSVAGIAEREAAGDGRDGGAGGARRARNTSKRATRWPTFTIRWRCRLPLYKAHRALDVAVDRCYRREPFTSERQRVEYLFALYEKLTSPLLAAGAKKRPPAGSSA